jgi:hypothetical protein
MYNNESVQKHIWINLWIFMEFETDYYWKFLYQKLNKYDSIV